jgi:hypothetical protein
MSGPGGCVACYYLSLNSRDIPVLFSTTFPKRSPAANGYAVIAKQANWYQLETEKWVIFLPSVLGSLPPKSKVLLLDDRVVSGESQKKAKVFLEGLGGLGLEVRLAAMIAEKDNHDFLDYVGQLESG